MSSEKIYLNSCKSAIGQKLGWVEGEIPRQRDFEYLSELIYQKTNIMLSVSTLKRIWAEDLKTLPHLNTLNTLAQFIDYTDWFDYKLKNTGVKNEGEKESPEQKETKLFFDTLSLKYVVIFFIIIALAVLSSIHFNKETGYLPEDIKFSSKKVVSSGVPNSVIFDYDVKGVESDSIFIQQSWDKRMRARINRERTQHTSIYYYPGYHKATLMINGDVVKQHDIHITTNGWLGLVRYEMNQLIPSYIPSNKLYKNNSLHVTKEVLEENNIPVNEKDFSLSFYNVREFGGLYGNDFTLETEIKSRLDEGASTCQDMMVFIMCENGRQAFPLGELGCAANLNFKTIDKWVRGSENDLSMFGCDMNLWNKVRYIAKDSVVNVYLNGKHIYEVGFEKDPGKVIGLHYIFHGTGSVNYVKLINGKGEIVFDDNFENIAERLIPAEFN